MSDLDLAMKIREAYNSLEQAINAAIEAKLEIQCSIDADDRWSNRVRTRSIIIKRKIEL